MNIDDDALAIYSGPRRTYEIFSLVAEQPRPISQILSAVPGAEDFIRSILAGMIEEDLITGNDAEYRLAARGERIRDSLNRLPQDRKIEAYKKPGALRRKRTIESLFMDLVRISDGTAGSY